MFSDETFSTRRDELVVETEADDYMYFQVAITGSQLPLVLRLQKCFGKPSGSRDPFEQYVFIENG